MTENKTKPTTASVEEFISKIENKNRRADALVALDIYKEVINLPPVMWGLSIIGFGSYHYKYASGREGDMPAAGFSPRKTNMTFYIYGHFDGASELFSRLGKHKRSVSCLYINKLDDVNLVILKEIIAKDFAAFSK